MYCFDESFLSILSRWKLLQILLFMYLSVLFWWKLLRFFYLCFKCLKFLHEKIIIIIINCPDNLNYYTTNFLIKKDWWERFDTYLSFQNCSAGLILVKRDTCKVTDGEVYCTNSIIIRITCLNIFIKTFKFTIAAFSWGQLKTVSINGVTQLEYLSAESKKKWLYQDY